MEQRLLVKEYAERLIKAATEGTTATIPEADKNAMLNADSAEAVQVIAASSGISTDVIEEETEKAGFSVATDLLERVKSAFSGAGIGGPENVESDSPEAGRQTYTINPLGAETAIPNTGLTPAEQESLGALTGADAELQATLFAAETGDPDDPDYILPEGVSADLIKAKVATPGYQFYYGDPADGQYARAIASPVIYTSGDELTKWTTYSPETRAKYTKAMVDAGLIDQEQVGGYTGGRSSQAELDAYNKLSNREKMAMSPADRPDFARGRYGERGQNYEGTAGGIDPSGVSAVQVDAYRNVLGAAGYLGTSPMSAIYAMGQNNEFLGTQPSGGGRGGGGGRAPFVVPASMRTIPDYATLQQNVTDMMRQVMGRKPEDWEVTMLADEMQGQYKEKNVASIDAARAAWEQGNRGVGEEIEVPDPGQRTQKYLEETWANEIDRIKDVGERANTNNLLMQSLTSGSRMVGG